MAYVLKQYDLPLLKFEMESCSSGFVTEILWQNDEKAFLLPLDLKSQVSSLTRWLKNRTIPANRAYVQNFLAKFGLNENDTKGILDICKGLSLNDAYWIVSEDFDGKFCDYNLYENRFSSTLSYMAFTGFGSYVRSSLRSSPEFTTGGMLAKCWRKISGEIYLYKSGTEGFANSGNEPYSEYYASQIANAMGLNAVKYGLSRWKGKLCSTCILFTSKDVSFVSVGRLVTSGGINAVLDYYKSLGENYYDDLMNMFLFDAIVCNEDRHFGNYGFLVDNKTNKIVGTAPIFDNGLSLFHHAMADDIKNLEQYAKARRPACYSDFLTFSKQKITHTQKEMLKRLIHFRFRRHSRYNLDNDRLCAIEKFIHNRIKELIKTEKDGSIYD